MNDWDVMILHYLGIDHIGHTQGPRGALMAPKQGEYDAIIDRIYSHVSAHDARTPGSSTLLVITGDHGMSATGNHGGSSPAERSTGLVFLSPHFAFAPKSAAQAFSEAATVRQVDICPTLSTLLGIAVPSQSTGKVITGLHNSDKEEIDLLERNMAHLKGISDAVGVRGLKKAYKKAAYSLKQYREGNLSRADAVSEVNGYIDAVSERLSSKWGGIDWYKAFAGVFVVVLAVLGAVFVIFALFSSEYLTARRASVKDVVLTVLVTFLASTSAHILLCMSGNNAATMPTCSAEAGNKAQVALFCLAAGLAFIPLYGTRFIRTFVMKVQSTGGANSLEALLGIGKASNAGKKNKEAPKFEYIAPPVPEYVDTVLCFLFTVAHCLSYFSSSLIEEEHQTLYFIVTTATLVHLGYAFLWDPKSNAKSPRGPIIKLCVMVAMICVIRAWNSTGARGTPGHGDIAELFSESFAYGDVVAKVGCVVAVAVLAWYTHRVLGYDNRVYLRNGRVVFEVLMFLAYALVVVYKFPLIQYLPPVLDEIVVARIIFGLIACAFVVGMFWPCVPGTTVNNKKYIKELFQYL